MIKKMFKLVRDLFGKDTTIRHAECCMFCSHKGSGVVCKISGKPVYYFNVCDMFEK